jgi:hypothetical protein
MKFLLFLLVLFISSVASAKSLGGSSKSTCYSCEYKTSSPFTLSKNSPNGLFPYLINQSAIALYKNVGAYYNQKTGYYLELHLVLNVVNKPACENCFCTLHFDVKKGLDNHSLSKSIQQITDRIAPKYYTDLAISCGGNITVSSKCTQGSPKKNANARHSHVLQVAPLDQKAIEMWTNPDK